MDLLDLSAKLTLDSSKYTEGIQNAKSLAEKVMSGLSQLGLAKQGFDVITNAVTSLGNKLVSSVMDVKNYGDNVDKMSQKIGISADAYQQWSYVMESAGTSIDSMKMGMKTLSVQAEANSADFQKLGITQQQVASMSQEELFTATVKGLAGMQEGTERAALASSLLGRASTDLGPLLNEGTAAIDAQLQEAIDYGMVMPQAAVDASAAFDDSMTKISGAATGLKNKFVADFFPAITTVIGGVTDLLVGKTDSGLKQVQSGVSSFIAEANTKIPAFMTTISTIFTGIGDAITQNLPAILEMSTGIITKLTEGLISALPTILTVAGQIIMAIGTGIMTALPTMIPAVIQIITQLVQTITENLPAIIQGAVQIIVALAEGLAEAIPTLTPTIVQCVLTIVQILGEEAPTLIIAGMEVLAAIISGLIQAIPQLVSNIPQIVTSIVNAFKSAAPRILEIGKGIVQGVWDGIQSMAKWLTDKVTDFFGGIVDGVKNFLGIHSPSTVFSSIGEYCMKGLGNGLTKGYNSVKAVSGWIADDLSDGFDIDTSTREGTVKKGVNVTQNIYAEKQTPAEIQATAEAYFERAVWA